ncbi:MAG: lytic transglycosylase domain-containing protein [Acidobacteriota bacterium]
MKIFHTLLPSLIAGALLATTGVQAEVRVETRPDGKVVVYNVGTSQRPQAKRSRSTTFRDGSRFAPLVRRHSVRYGLDPALVDAVIRVESSYDPRARSHKGAMGLMQLMPATARELAVENAYDPEQNVRGGVTYLRRMLDHFGSLDLALAAYNAGPTAVTRHSGIPPYAETERYVEKVLSLYRGRPVKVARLSSAPKPRLERDSANRVVLTNKPLR